MRERGPQWARGGGCSEGKGFQVPALELAAGVWRGMGLGSSQGHSPTRVPGGRGHGEGSPGPRVQRAGLLLFKDRGPLPQFLPRGEAEEASPGEFGGLRASEILLQTLRGLGPTSGCSRGAESRQGQEQGCWKWGVLTPPESPAPKGGLPQRLCQGPLCPQD